MAAKKAQSSILYYRKKFLVASKEEQEVIIVFIEVEHEINIKNNDCHVLIFNHCFQLWPALSKTKKRNSVIGSDNLFKTTKRYIKPKYWYNLKFKLQRQKGNRLKEQDEKLNHSLTVVRVIAK